MRFTSPCLVLLLLVTSSISAKTPSLPHQNESALSISRYVDVLPGPTNAQKNPMHLVLPHISFKHNIQSVGQAINFLLSDTGYKLTRHHPDRRVHNLFRLSLPKIHRNMGPLTLAQALIVLAGEPWRLSVDPINRLVSFQLPDYFKQVKSQNRNQVKKKSTRPLQKKESVSITDRQMKKLNRQYQSSLQAKKQKTRAKIHKKHIVKRAFKKPTHELVWADIPKELR